MLQDLLSDYQKEVAKCVGCVRKDLGSFGKDIVDLSTLKFLEHYNGLDEKGNKLDAQRLTVRFAMRDGDKVAPEMILHRYYHEGDFENSKGEKVNYRVFYKITDGRRVLDITDMKRNRKTRQNLAILLGGVFRFATIPNNNLWNNKSEVEDE